MKDEIKEILDKLKDDNWYDELDLTGTMWIELKWEETHLLLDYITNLQEKDKQLDKYKNVVDKIKEYCKEEINNIKNNYSQVNGNYFNMNYVLDTYENVLDKLNELLEEVE